MSSDQCTIPPNPDVSGIGVRYAIYIQNILCFMPVIMNLIDDGKISADELKGIQDQSVGMLAIAFSILVTTIILAKGAGGSQGITNYHASIVLDLSWMNNTSTWIWFILYVHSRSKPRELKDAPVPATLRAWYNLLPWQHKLSIKSEKEGREGIIHRFVRGVFCIIQHIPSIPFPSFASIFRNMRSRWNSITDSRILQWFLTKIFRPIWSAASEYPVLTLGSFHLSLMAAVGVWLWSDPSNFGLHTNCNPTIEVVDAPAHLLSRPLEVTSIAFYSLFLAPVFNLGLPFFFFLALHISYNWLRECWDEAKKQLKAKEEEAKKQSEKARIQDIEAIPVNDSLGQSSANAANNNHGNSSVSPPHTAFLVVGLLCLLVVNILFMINIELTLRRNQANQTGGDNDWGFGQVLALLLLIVPLRDAWKALQEIREKLRNSEEQQQKQLEDSKKQKQKQLEDFFRTACEMTPADKELKHLLEHDSDITSGTQITGSEGIIFNSFLPMAAYYGKADLVKCLQHGCEEKRGKIGMSNHLQQTD
jgi:hypothetical protein